MKQEELKALINTATLKGEPLETAYEETHISWVVFSKSYALKIKKPLRLSFLDFSSLELRKKYCELEFKLNKRFSSIYLAVVALREEKGLWSIGGRRGPIKEYAVLMERLNTSLRMDKMLKAKEVNSAHIQALAQEIAAFHQQAAVVREPFDLDKSKSLFNDIATVKDCIAAWMGGSEADFIQHTIHWSDSFLASFQDHIQRRINRGCQRDLHGDLHAGNIFLYQKPVLFDCIEFDASFRQIDLLYELAFLCMELEIEGYEDFAAEFMLFYQELLPVIGEPEDLPLFLYYKCLRANIRSKITALSVKEQAGAPSPAGLHKIGSYLKLMAKYIQQVGDL
ncbi:MAG TPA: hypothetical protein VK014_01665 [Cyclobacteriaceae bacterium]|nr:hypothetical protein [Cyclobacteriaceae bacterium]